MPASDKKTIQFHKFDKHVVATAKRFRDVLMFGIVKTAFKVVQSYQRSSEITPMDLVTPSHDFISLIHRNGTIPILYYCIV